MLRLALVVVLLAATVAETTASYAGSGPHIADVNILLPPKMTYPVEYRLQGSDGCFKWSWDHHDILSVLPEYNMSSHCSTSARLHSIAPYGGRKETAVYATDVYTGNVIRCKVFIDNFTRIQIFHNSIKLDLDGLATLRVRAFDGEDNVFSSLVGLQFKWQLVPEITGVSNHLAHVPLKDSPLGDCGGLCGDLDIQTKLENTGVHTDLYVVKGVRIGHEIVSVHLLEPQLGQMADKIVLTVAEAMSLDPSSPVLVLIGAVVHYRLKVIRGNVPQVVSLPSPHHQWSVSNSSVALVDSKIGLTCALSLGVTSVIVEDTRVVGHKQLSSLNVVLPDTISLYISPLSNSGDPLEEMKVNIPSMTRWYIVSGRQYLVQLKVFSSPYSQEIYTTEADDVKWFGESEFWKIFAAPDYISDGYGCHSRILKAASQGMEKLTASLTYYTRHQESKEVLKVVQEVMVCDQVKFNLGKTANKSQGLLLPWAPAIYQELELKLTGGCAKTSSDYKWFSSDMAVVSVSTSGIIQAKRPGKATVKAVSIFDAFNYDEVLVAVSRPSSMAMLPKFPVETVVGSHLQAAVTMKAQNGAYFYRCDAFSSLIKWKTESESFAIVNATEEIPDPNEFGDHDLDKLEIGPTCSLAYIYASNSGQSMLHATLSKEYYKADPAFQGSNILKATSPIAAYQQLIVRQASDGNQFGGYGFSLAQTKSNNQLESLDQLFLVPGTHLDVMLLGGPERWASGVDFLETVDIINKETAHSKVVLVQKLPGTASCQDLYRVSCLMPGTSEVLFKRGNSIGDDHPLAVIAEVSLLLICNFPASITLIPDEPVNECGIIQTATQAERDEERMRVTSVAVANGRTIRIAAVGIATSGEAFANSSSLSLSWELNNCDGLAYWDDVSDSEKSRSSWERFLFLKNESGMCIVHATVIEFPVATVSSHSDKVLDKLGGLLTDAVRLQFVSTLRLDPEFSLLYFNHNAKEILSITGGSSFLEAVVNDTQVVDVQCPSGTECSQLMLSPKGLGSSVVTVHDIGVSPSLEASAVVLVADLDWIKIVSGEEISLMEGSRETIEVTAGIVDGNTFASSQYAYMNIQVLIEDDVVELIEDDVISVPGGGYISAPKFKILGKHLGITTLHISARQQSGHEIFSHPVKVEVYPPPRIYPHDIFLVPGGSFVVILKGGPTIGVHVEYSSTDNKIATVDKLSAQLSAISPGNTTLVARVYKHGGGVICQAYGNVKVGIPSSVMLNTQSDQIGVGMEMPIYPLFPEGDAFSYYELCRDFKWTIDDGKVLSFHVAEELDDVMYKAILAKSKESRFSSFLDENELEFIKILHARSPGRTMVGVSFLCDFRYPGSSTQSRSYSASTSLLVVSDLPLALGAPATWILPPHYTTSSLLPSAAESYGQWDVQSRRGNILYSLLKSERNDLMQKDDISIDGELIKTGESNNIACIQAKDRTTRRIDIAACVRVAEVTQIQVDRKEFPFHVINLAVGGDLEIPIRCYDHLGYPFYEAYNAVPVYADTSNPNIVSINITLNGKGYILLKGMQHGKALLRVSVNNNPLKSDYRLISVGAHLNPQKPVVHVGGYLNFTVEGYGAHTSGQWFSGNESVLSVDKTLGMARAVGEGSAQVYYKSTDLKLQTPVIVLTGDIIHLDSPKEILTNSPSPSRGFNFSVRFSDTYGKKLKALGDSKRVPFNCQVDPPFVGYAKPWVDLDSGMSYCLFFPYTPEQLAHSMTKSKDVRSAISVSITASLREASHVSGSASALFVGGFSFLENDKDPLKLNLTPEFDKTIITILGNTDVKIHWKARSSMIVSLIYHEGSGIGRKAQYEVKVLTDQGFQDKISITLPATGQKAEIDVSFEPGGRPDFVFNTTSTFWATVLGTFALLIVTVAFFIRFLDKPDRNQPLSTVATTGVTAPVTPKHSSPSVSSDQSPRTPQPFVDYVRRTIDEAPYYRREGRRRFNPQKTF